MNTGEYLKKLRSGENKYGKVLSQDELGKLLNPPVWRTAVNKWETGAVKHIKKEYIEQIAVIFGVTPTELMCFDSRFDEQRISEEVKVIEQVQKYFGRNAVQLLQYFYELNDAGKQKALDDLADLTEIPKYSK